MKKTLSVAKDLFFILLFTLGMIITALSLEQHNFPILAGGLFFCIVGILGTRN